MDGRRRKRRWAAAAALAVLGGCAYQLTRETETLDAARVAALRKVVVAPFRYPHDWTGQFRAIYRRAGLRPPPRKKVERIEATFLVEEEVAKLGYEVLPWPEATGNPPPAEGALPLERLRRRLPRIRRSGADAVVLARGESRCERIDLCTARAEVVVVESARGRIIWRGRASGTSFFEQGGEMRAAVRAVVGGLPRGRAAP